MDLTYVASGWNLHILTCIDLEPFSRCHIQRSNRIHDVLHSRIEMFVLLVDIPHIHMPFAPTSKIIYSDIGLYGHFVFDYCIRSRDRILRLLL